MSKFSNKIFWLKNVLFRNSSYLAYKEALYFDGLGADEKEKYSFAKMKRLIEYAYNNVPYYRNYYDSKGFNPCQFKSFDDVHLIPILEKEALRANTASFLSNQYSIKDLQTTTTGGSTGTPLQIYKNPRTPVEVMGWRAFYWWGIQPSDNVGILHRRTPMSVFSKIKNRTLWWPTKRAYLNATVIDPDMISYFVKEIQSQQTKWLQGYCSALEVVADYVISRNIKINGVELVWCTSSPLTNTVRAKLEKAFGCAVMDQYGCCEMWNIAMQKKNEPYLTICNDYVHVDIVRNDGTNCEIGEQGDILITDLDSFPFPIIRYRLGDRSSMVIAHGESADGYPKMDFVRGRISDTLIMPSGKLFDGAYLTTIFDSCPELIDSFQILQKKDYSVLLKIKLKNYVSPQNVDVVNIINALREQIENEVSLHCEFVSDMNGDNGKKRYIISEIALNSFY